VCPFFEIKSASNRNYMIALLSSDGRGKARAKSADQKSEECPVQGMCYGLAGGIGRLPGLAENVRHALFGVGLTEARSCCYQLT
jgi:predicted alpha/beta-fold hydrolase